jgi:peptidyl-prolyl cis-trans isomerase SurA
MRWPQNGAGSVRKSNRQSRTCCPGIYNDVYASGSVSSCLPCADLMTLRFLRIPAAIVFGTVLLASPTLAPAQNTAPQSPYGGITVEDIIARVNDQIISRSDYDRAMAEVDQEARQRGATSLQEIAAAHKDLLRNLIDQQLWLSKGKELGVNGDTELIKRLNEIRKQYHLDTIEDLEKAAKDQGVSFEDFKANIRNGIITQNVMRQEVGSSIRFTPGEAERYYEQHKRDYAQPESVTLSEILISTSAAGSSDPAKLAAAKAKADDVESRLHAGGDFSQLAKSFSDGPTAAQGGDLGQYQRGALPKALEDKTFPLKAGEITEPILTRQGYVILKVVQHVSGGARPYKEVSAEVEDAFYMSRMEPAIRAYLTKMREDAFIDIKPGYIDTGASPNETKPIYSAYTPPAPKKKAKVERTRFRETTHTFRQKSPQAVLPAAAAPEPAPAPAVVKASAVKTKKHAKSTDAAVEKPGKREKIRFGQKPRETLPSEPNGAVENAGALPEAAAATPEPVNPLEAQAPDKKTRFSTRARLPKQVKQTGPQPDALAPPAPDAADVADRATQSGPLGLAGDTASKKSKKATTEGEKTRLANRKKEPGTEKQQPQFTPAPQEPGAPAPAPAPVPQPQTQQ